MEAATDGHFHVSSVFVGDLQVDEIWQFVFCKKATAKKFFKGSAMAKKPKRGGAREGAGRPVSEAGPAITIVASVPKSLVDGLDERAKAEGWGRSRAVQEAIRALLKRKTRA